MSRFKAVWARVQRTRLWLTWQRYSRVQGNLLAGGVGYFAFFSVFPAVLLAFTVFGYVLRDRPELLAQVKDAINAALPGFIKTPDNPNGIISIDAPSKATLSVGGIVSVLGLIYTGTGWLSAVRTAFQVILGVNPSATNFVVGKVRDLAVLVLLGVAFVASAVLSAVAGSTAKSIAELIGLGHVSWVLSGVSLVLGLLLDSCIVGLLLRVLPGVALPWRQLRGAALVGGLGLTVLKRVGSLLLSGTLENPLYASFALVVGLLVWLNLMSRIILLAAAWAAADHAEMVAAPAAEDHEKAIATAHEKATAKAHAEGVDQPATSDAAAPVPAVSVARTPAGHEARDTVAVRDARGTVAVRDARAVDRASLAVGAVLGAAAALALGAVRRRD